MKTKSILSALAIMAIFAACNSASNKQNFNLDTTTLKAGQMYYQCPMHPEQISDKMGLCPDCEMDLSEKVKK